MAALGAEVPLLDYTQALQARNRMGVAMNLFHRDYDLLVLPTMPLPAFAAGHNAPPDGPFAGWQDWTPFTYPFNLTQQPAASVPCGLTSAGLPVGVQIVGRLHDELTVLRACSALEDARPWSFPANGDTDA
jgi:aspartyl-tRNA(Asn)/glutamyl-tRNA(Gln) amidotransferase subunit A